MNKRLLLAFGVLLIGIFACSNLMAGAAVDPFAGTFSGEAPRSRQEIRKAQAAGVENRALVDELIITRNGDAYKLDCEMDETNREEGMDHVSHTHSHWTGVGRLQGDKLLFSWVDDVDPALPREPADKGNGTIRRRGKKLVMTLHGVDYVLSKKTDQSS